MPDNRRTRLWGAVVSVVVLLAVLEPLLRRPTDDSFPLSTYPMFATHRPVRVSLTYALIVTADDQRAFVPPRFVGTGEVLQAGAMLSRSAGASRASQQELCKRIAERVARSGRWPGFRAISVVTGTHDSIAFLTEGVRGPENELYRCAAPGGGS